MLLSIYSHHKILALFPILYNTPLSLFTSSSLYLPGLHPYIAPPPSLPTDNH